MKRAEVEKIFRTKAEPLLGQSSARGPLQFRIVDGLAEWDARLANFDRQPVGFHSTHVEYQRAYFSTTGQAYRTLPLAIDWQGRPAGLFYLACHGDDPPHLASHINGSPHVAPPIFFIDLPEKAAKHGARQWLALLGQIALAADIEHLTLAAPDTTGSLPHWHRLVLEAGAHMQPRFKAVVDLGIPAKAYHSSLRKSYKSLINNAGRLWRVTVDHTGDQMSFDAFQALHIQVAGRRTRSTESWAIQLEAIRQKAAFAVYLHDNAARLVGASLFNVSRDEALYAVGAYDRSLFDQPLAHLSLSSAIAVARDMGMRRFIIGDRPYPGDTPPPTEKELQIAFFKEGFANDLVLVPNFEISSQQLTGLVAPD